MRHPRRTPVFGRHPTTLPTTPGTLRTPPPHPTMRRAGLEWSILKPGWALPPPTGTVAVPSGVLHTSGAGCADDWLGVSSRSPARPCRRPPAPRPGPAGLAAASNRSGCLCDVRPGPAGPAAPPIGRACRLCVDRLRRRPPAPRLGRPNLPCPPGRPNRLRTRIGYCDMDRL